MLEGPDAGRAEESLRPGAGGAEESFRPEAGCRRLRVLARGSEEDIVMAHADVGI